MSSSALVTPHGGTASAIARELNADAVPIVQGGAANTRRPFGLVVTRDDKAAV
jgi:hypothetical protein